MKMFIAIGLSLCACTALAFEGKNAYGPGVHMDTTGRPYTYQGQDGNPVNPQGMKRNGYGLGVGVDEYGRPLRARAQDGSDAPLLRDENE